MCVLILTIDYVSSVNCTDYENENVIIIIKLLLLSVPSGVLLLSLTSLIIWTTLQPLLANGKMDKFLYPQHPVHYNIQNHLNVEKVIF